LNQLSNQIGSTVGQTPGLALAATFIQNDIALSEYVLDGLANELQSAGNTPLQASLDAILAEQVLALDELHALYDIGDLHMGNGNGG